jgi:hypothetical protein
MDKKEQDVRDLIRQEGRRGRRPIDLGAQRERREKLTALRKLLEIGTEADFVKAVRAFGLREGSPEFLASLEIWRGYRS